MCSPIEILRRLSPISENRGKNYEKGHFIGQQLLLDCCKDNAKAFF